MLSAKVTMTELPTALLDLIELTQELLFDVIKQHAGCETHELIQKLHQEMIQSRKINQQTCLLNTQHQLSVLKKQQKHAIAHGFTLMIELINSCETAYRTHRLERTKDAIQQNTACNVQPGSLIFVLTAHPTEARSPANITLFHHIQTCCEILLHRTHHDLAPDPKTLDEIKHWLNLAWLTPVAKHKRPRVIDEAESIFSIVLRPEILNAILLNRQLGVDVRIRTWVGGDKDGHPGIDEQVMLSVMNCARKRFIQNIHSKFKRIQQDLHGLNHNPQTLSQQINQSLQALAPLKQLHSQDGWYLKRFKASFSTLLSDYQNAIGTLHPELNNLSTLLDAFPGLIIPLELREDARVVRDFLKDKESCAIVRMLQSIHEFCHHSSIDYYIKGLVLSMTQSVDDIQAGIDLAQHCLPGHALPIIPLFETEQALACASSIVRQLFQEKNIKNMIQHQWENKFEVMLGYSDSSKGMGVLASKLAIAKAMHELDILCHEYQIKPIFFHGSGGSVDRGGGSIEQQTSWWPDSCFTTYKTTLQGEMVERSFASKEILTSMFNKLLHQRNSNTQKHTKFQNKVVDEFASEVSKHYQQLLQSPKFLKVVNLATGYRLLDKLKFGSRPAKRGNTLSLETLRAIPWVLCWTQTRILLPTWWGVGSAWQKMPAQRQSQLHRAFTNDALFSAFIKQLGFTLSKVDLPIWRLYLQTSTLSPQESSAAYRLFEQEYQATCEAFNAISQKEDLVWFRPWLTQSIELRAPMIHPLNLLQIDAIDNNDAYLIRETTTGIASGMLTTG